MKKQIFSILTALVLTAGTAALAQSGAKSGKSGTPTEMP